MLTKIDLSSETWYFLHNVTTSILKKWKEWSYNSYLAFGSVSVSIDFQFTDKNRPYFLSDEEEVNLLGMR